jgi:TM2 domain-containing membrane protein YozV
MTCGVAVNSVKPADAKSRMAAGILGIIFGGFGVHNFYLGYTKKAIIQLVVMIVGLLLSCVGIGIFISAGMSIWGLVEGIMLLTGKITTDGKGNPLAD